MRGARARAGTAAVRMLPLRASAPRPAAGQRDSEAPRAPGSSHGGTVFARTEHAARRPRAGARTASARRGAGQHRPGGPAAAGGLETPPPPAAPGKRGGGRGGGRQWGGGQALPGLALRGPRPLPGSSFASASLPYPSGCHSPSALRSPRGEAAARRSPRAPAHRLGRGRGGGAPLPQPGPEAGPKLGIGGVIAEPGSNPGAPRPHPPTPSCRKHHPCARVPSLCRLASPSDKRWYRLRELRPPPGNQNLAGLPSGPNTKGRSRASRQKQRGLQTLLMQMFSICN
ncbi:translation initiation factor IF-2-like [Moschus berezovskii]|uniref:translation initiation factor IF-2-like n=1 Tax=Moschus berezovskii TaxID=68408 RepID=UPI002444E77A|nr:translation initiation factor IF-2-like [Moschus berezovskii]